jgi:hypothetical protein
MYIKYIFKLLFLAALVSAVEYKIAFLAPLDPSNRIAVDI